MEIEETMEKDKQLSPLHQISVLQMKKSATVTRLNLLKRI